MTFMFRKVKLPNEIAGKLYLHSMPGRYEDWQKFASEVNYRTIDFIVCLTSEVEIKKESQSYAEARFNNTLPCLTKDFPINDLR